VRFFFFFFTFVLKPKSYEPMRTLSQSWQNWVLAALAATWLAAQNVGIGTTTPLTRLHVAEGDIFLGDAAGANGFVLHSRSSAGYDYFQISTRTGGTYEWSKGITLVRSSGNVDIGTTTPHSAAILQLQATDKGFLPTRVALTSATSWSPLVGTPVNGMLVYNTATAGTGQNAVSPGYYYWRDGRWRRLTENAYAGVIRGVLASPGQNLTSNCWSWQYLNSYIDLPPGKWIVYSVQLLSPSTISTVGSIWVRTTLSDNSSCSPHPPYSSDIIGSWLISGILPHEARHGLVNGQIFINNTSGSVKRYYYCGCKEPYNGYNVGLSGFSTTAWDENQLYALPAE
jgi:hypothetical protein